MEIQELEKKLSDTVAESARLLSEKDVENKRLSEELAKVNGEKREKLLSEEVEKLCLSDTKTIGFKGGEKEKVLEFVKTLSEEQAKAYFLLHTNIITGVNLWEEGETGDDTETVTDDTAAQVLNERAKALSEKNGITYRQAADKVLAEDPELAKKIA